jgi:hypothetical protein
MVRKGFRVVSDGVAIKEVFLGLWREACVDGDETLEVLKGEAKVKVESEEVSFL